MGAICSGPSSQFVREQTVFGYVYSAISVFKTSDKPMPQGFIQGVKHTSSEIYSVR
ncbi:Hypothetical protein HEAR0599 [Herminiimonas arsenicoxydans]|uniref:Uncharacterized protein n=1 Tax=Herminiimonas arsenicoxydans TaxID=204773 RepID=A4G2R2_HERAR|nr:Hypothetical protein HEAR0599 [Herminiimonas arsenicoxydans]